MDRLARWNDWKVFAQYGRTMLSVQQLESSLKRWAHLRFELGEDPSFEEAWGKLRPVLHGRSRWSADGEQISPELARELGGAVATAHSLRDGYLLAYSERARWSSEDEPTIEELRMIGARFDAARVKVDGICAALERARRKET